MSDRTYDSRPLRVLNIVDEYPQECLATVVRRQTTAEHVLECLGDLFLRRGLPKHLRSHGGPKSTAEGGRTRLRRISVKTLIVQKDSTRKNGYVESFNGRMRDV